MKIVVNRCFGGFSLSKEACKYLDIWDAYEHLAEEKRTDPKLIECVETLGSERASGLCAELEVVEIPDDVDWFIDDYDGLETIRERHRTW